MLKKIAQKFRKTAQSLQKEKSFRQKKLFVSWELCHWIIYLLSVKWKFKHSHEKFKPHKPVCQEISRKEVHQKWMWEQWKVFAFFCFLHTRLVCDVALVIAEYYLASWIKWLHSLFRVRNNIIDLSIMLFHNLNNNADEGNEWSRFPNYFSIDFYCGRLCFLSFVLRKVKLMMSVIRLQC